MLYDAHTASEPAPKLRSRETVVEYFDLQSKQIGPFWETDPQRAV